MSQRNAISDSNSPDASGEETLNANARMMRSTTTNYLSSEDDLELNSEEEIILINETNNDSIEQIPDSSPVAEIQNTEVRNTSQNQVMSQTEDNNPRVINYFEEMQNTNPQAKRWVFTWNNPPENWAGILAQLTAVKQLKLEFIIGCFETGQLENTPHIQGYARFNKKVYYRTLRSKIQCFWDVARGDEASNIEYCTKQNGEKFSWGKPRTEKGKKFLSAKQKVEKLREDVIKHNWQEFEQLHPVESTYQKNIWLTYKYEHSDLNAIWEGDLKCKNFWIWGPPGTGKSKWAWHQKGRIYLKLSNKWWDGFHLDDYSIVLIEDWPCDKQMLAQNMKTWADRYKFIAEVKGGTIWVPPSKYKLIVTSNYSISQCFNPGDVEAIQRRFNEIHIETAEDIRLLMDIEI